MHFFFPNSSLMHGGQDFPPLGECLSLSSCLWSLYTEFRTAQLLYGETENILNRSGDWHTTGSRICEGKSSEQDPWSHIGKQFKSLAALLSWESPSGREVCALALEKLQRHSWRVNSWFGSVTTPVMATVMRGFSRLHPSWLSWINCECPAYRTWKVFSLSATGPFWKQSPSKASRAQNWLSNNPGVHS